MRKTVQDTLELSDSSDQSGIVATLTFALKFCQVFAIIVESSSSTKISRLENTMLACE